MLKNGKKILKTSKSHHCNKCKKDLKILRQRAENDYVIFCDGCWSSYQDDYYFGGKYDEHRFYE